MQHVLVIADMHTSWFLPIVYTSLYPSHIFIPRACARGKVFDRIVVVIVVSTKIPISRDVDI